jgi:hypothetical protein
VLFSATHSTSVRLDPLEAPDKASVSLLDNAAFLVCRVSDCIPIILANPETVGLSKSFEMLKFTPNEDRIRPSKRAARSE